MRIHLKTESTGGSSIRKQLNQKQKFSLRDAAGEVDACQVLGGGDGVSEHGTISWEELDDVWRQTALPQDSVDGVAGGHGGVAGLPQNDVPLQNTSSSTQQTHGGGRAATPLSFCPL